MATTMYTFTIKKSKPNQNDNKKFRKTLASTKKLGLSIPLVMTCATIMASLGLIDHNLLKDFLSQGV